MNKTLLLVICDFLLLNLLALTRWEKAEPVRPPRAAVPQVVSAAKTTEQDLVETMRLSLADEQNARTELAAQLATKEQNLARLESEKNNLSSSLSDTQRQAAELDKKLAEAAQSSAVDHSRLAQLQRELDLKQAEAAQRKEQLDALEKAHREARDRIEGLSVAVKVSEKEKALLRETADTLKQQVEAERQERQKVNETSLQLAQGVGQLAEKSGELSREIRDNRPINANVLFNDFLANRVTVRVNAERQNSLIGKIQRGTTAYSILVADGSQVYALLHITDTPFNFQEFIYDWNQVSFELQFGDHRIEPSSLAFLTIDPRIIALPLDSAQVAALGCKVYPLTAEPFKFPDAMLVNKGGRGYGETPFKLESTQPSYVRMDNRIIKHLLGDFTPSRGDLVFSKSGEFLGLMVSSDYCAILSVIVPSRTLKLGDTAGVSTAKLFSEMEARFRSLPFRMQ